MKHLIYFIIILFCCFSLQAQNTQKPTTTDNQKELKVGNIKGFVIDAKTNRALENVNIVNLSQIIGTATNNKGEFELSARANDTLHFSYIGYKSIKVRVTNDWINRIEKSRIILTELALALEEVELSSFKLTGYLEVDINQVVINDNYQYRIAGIGSSYEAGSKRPGAISRVLGAIFNPLDFIHNTFSKKGKQMRLLKRMKEDDEIRNNLAKRFDRDMLTAFLKLSKEDLDNLISKCNYSKEFINTANDLQVLDALSECYEEYKVLKKK